MDFQTFDDHVIFSLNAWLNLKPRSMNQPETGSFIFLCMRKSGHRLLMTYLPEAVLKEKQEEEQKEGEGWGVPLLSAVI